MVSSSKVDERPCAHELCDMRGKKSGWIDNGNNRGELPMATAVAAKRQSLPSVTNFFSFSFLKCATTNKDHPTRRLPKKSMIVGIAYVSKTSQFPDASSKNRCNVCFQRKNTCNLEQLNIEKWCLKTTEKKMSFSRWCKHFSISENPKATHDPKYC